METGGPATKLQTGVETRGPVITTGKRRDRRPCHQIADRGRDCHQITDKIRNPVIKARTVTETRGPVIKLHTEVQAGGPVIKYIPEKRQERQENLHHLITTCYHIRDRFRDKRPCHQINNWSRSRRPCHQVADQRRDRRPCDTITDGAETGGPASNYRPE